MAPKFKIHPNGDIWALLSDLGMLYRVGSVLSQKEIQIFRKIEMSLELQILWEKNATLERNKKKFFVVFSYKFIILKINGFQPYCNNKKLMWI